MEYYSVEKRNKMMYAKRWVVDGPSRQCAYPGIYTNIV